jgi:hypothetical protein
LVSNNAGFFNFLYRKLFFANRCPDSVIAAFSSIFISEVSFTSKCLIYYPFYSRTSLEIPSKQINSVFFFIIGISNSFNSCYISIVSISSRKVVLRLLLYLCYGLYRNYLGIPLGIVISTLSFFLLSKELNL